MKAYTGDITLARELIKEFEGCRLTVYHCQAGKATIGYGHLCKESQTPITQVQAEALLELDIRQFASSLWKLLKPVSLLVTSNEFNAMLSLIFNIGRDNFMNSTLLRLYLAGEIDAVDEEFLKWVYVAGRINKGLQRRRKREAQLFTTP